MEDRCYNQEKHTARAESIHKCTEKWWFHSYLSLSETGSHRQTLITPLVQPSSARQQEKVYAVKTLAGQALVHNLSKGQRLPLIGTPFLL